MLKVVFEGKKEISSGVSEGDVAHPTADLVSSAVALILPIASSVILALHYESLAIDEGRLSIGKCLRDAGGVEPSIGAPSVGMSDPHV